MMRLLRLRVPGTRRLHLRSDEGMTIVELMAALVVFGIASTGIAAGFIAMIKKSGNDKFRIGASNLAARELEVARNQFNSGSTGLAAVTSDLDVTNGYPLAGGTVGQPLVVDTTPYTVRRVAQWLPTGTGKSACDGGTAVTYPSLAVRVVVTWPGSVIKPVESNTVLTPPKNLVSGSLGFVAVKVVKASGGPAVGVPVSLTGAGTYDGTTGPDGCATVAVSNQGTYAVKPQAPGAATWVDFYGATAPSKNITTVAGSIKQLTFNFDEAALGYFTLATASGFKLPLGLTTSVISNVGLQPTGLLSVPTSSASATSNTLTTTTPKALWPFVDGYSVWAGSCNQSDPAVSGGSRPAAVTLASGATGTLSMDLAPVTVTVTLASLVAVPNAQVLATPVSNTGCAAGENPLSLGTTDSAGRIKVGIPAGNWNLSVSGRTLVAAVQTGVLLPTSSPSSVGVKVV